MSHRTKSCGITFKKQLIKSFILSFSYCDIPEINRRFFLKFLFISFQMILKFVEYVILLLKRIDIVNRSDDKHVFPKVNL
jgi:hypothetical protein